MKLKYVKKEREREKSWKKNHPVFHLCGVVIFARWEKKKYNLTFHWNSNLQREKKCHLDFSDGKKIWKKIIYIDDEDDDDGDFDDIGKKDIQNK